MAPGATVRIASTDIPTERIVTKADRLLQTTVISAGIPAWPIWPVFAPSRLRDVGSAIRRRWNASDSLPNTVRSNVVSWIRA